uniref:Uncharacterized protein n=1 Tax=Chenopodium quinoa TaxID=63459 RepID=A0A803LPE5_CHEQI
MQNQAPTNQREVPPNASHGFPPPLYNHPPFGTPYYPNYGYTPLFYPYNYNHFPFFHAPSPGSYGFINSSNTNGSGKQTNGDVKVGNNSSTSLSHVKIRSIGGNHDNIDSQNKSGDVTLGDIGRIK